MAFRLPGDITTLDDLWRVLQNGENQISEVDPARFPFKNYYHQRKTELGKSYTFNAGVLSRIDEFDAAFFGITPREAQQMDPQQRLLLETTWDALENGCQNIEQLAGSNCGVYIGIGNNEHMFNYVNDTSTADSYTMLGSCSSIASNRISYIFDFHGPSLSIDTACSSSLVALHQACCSLWHGETSMAIAGGVNLLLSPTSFVGFAKASMLSPEGQCKSFAANGNGYVRAEGCVVLFLKPLEAAERDGDPIHAVILNSGVNSDGHTNGITFPSADAQAALITHVHQQAGISANEIQYIEAHGTGTMAGDKTEAMALSVALAKQRRKDNPLLIGSIKSNLGHLEVASGLTGVLKTILCLRHKIIPPTLHAENPNPDIPFDELNLKVIDKSFVLEKQQKPVIMAVNSFGFGGTNAHIILSEYEHPPKAPSSYVQALIPPLMLSARNEDVFPALARQYVQMLRNHPEDYYHIAYALSHRRTPLAAGAIIYGNDVPSICDSLEQLVQGNISPHVVTEQRFGKNLPLALVFSGNGSQWQGMASELIENEPIFIETMNEIDNLLANYADFSVKTELLATIENSRYDNTEIAQPCIFALQVATTRYLRQHGVQIKAVTGHSIGEIAAAWASGALSLAQATELVYKRSFWQGKTRGQGRMLATALSVDDAEELIKANDLNQLVEIAAMNSPYGITLAGQLSALKKIQAICKKRHVFHRLLDLDYAFHSQQMDPIQEGLLNSIANLKPQKNSIAYISTVTGTELPGKKLNADYWWLNIRKPVKFNEAINTLLDQGIQLFIEVGPHPVLKNYIDESLRARNARGLVIPTFKRHAAQLSALDHTLFRTWLSGAEFDKTPFFPAPGKLITLPSYPWHRTSHKLTPSNESVNQVNLLLEHPLLGHRIKAGEAIWENHIDPFLVPYLADHMVDNVAIMPAAGYAEMAIAASTLWFGNKHHDLRDMDILAPMVFDEKSCRMVRFELQTTDGSFIIKSRPRHTDEPWVQHVVGRIISTPALLSSNAKIDIETLQTKAPSTCRAEQFYNMAQSKGLTYGPMFRTVSELWVNENQALARLDVQQIDLLLKTHYVYPGILDACFQLLIGLLSYSQQTEGTVLPIRMGRIQLLAPLPEKIFLTAEVLTKSKQSVLANFSILNNEGDVIAIINDCRFKKAYFSEQANAAKMYLLKPYLLGSFEQKTAIDFTTLENIQTKIAAHHSIKDKVDHFESVMPLMDLLVSHFIYEAITALAANQTSISLPTFLNSVPIAPSQQLLLTWCLTVLSEDKLLQKEGEDQFRILQRDNDVNAASIWNLLLSAYPQYLTELLLLGRIGLHLQDLLRGEVAANALFYSQGKNDALQHFYEGSPSVRGSQEMIYKTLPLLLEKWPNERRIRVLDIGYSTGELARRIIDLFPAEKTDYHLIIADENIPPSLGAYSFVNVKTQSLNQYLNEIEALAHPPQFDVIISRNYLHSITDLHHTLRQLHSLLAHDGVFLLSEFTSDRLHEFILGTQSNWWQQTQDGRPLSPLNSVKNWQQHFMQAGFKTTQPLYERGGSEQEGAFLLLAQPSTKPLQTAAIGNIDHEKSTQQTLVLTTSEEALPLYQAIKAWKDDALLLTIKFSPQQLTHLEQQLKPFAPQQKKLCIVWACAGTPDLPHAIEECTAIINLAKAIQNLQWQVPPQLIVMTRHAIPFTTVKENPTQATVWGVGRVLQNEHPELACKLIDLQGELSTALIANAAREIYTQDDESEVIVTATARYGLRVDVATLPGPTSMPPATYRLDFKRAGSLSNLHWFPIPSSALAADEVLVSPQASGLNFRDLMYAMGLIPDEAVENGFLGATLGMEFAGKVLAVGEAVTDVAVGDRVMGFAPASFSSTTVTKAHAITALPAQWSYATAATIPIAFFTAYYAIYHLARIEPGERILIHGAAGGVGIAAIQVARYLGAEIYATAGSAEKRDFLRLMGISNLYDSRTLSFADEILKDTSSEGVDVVLNCLAGEAIHANLNIIKPFGRFLELGKRDFFANSKVGLRPFRNNISYFGIDADQLLMKNPALCTRLFQSIMTLFEQECLTPLPYREFAAQHISDGFRYMQQARHMGKIIVNFAEKPLANSVAPPTSSLSLSPDKSYLVTGGLSGFGLQTAQWLVEKGARHLVLVSRHGASSEEAKQSVRVLENRGVNIVVNTLDVSNAAAVEAMLKTERPGFPPLKGIIHAAAVYDDAFVQQQSAEKMKNVLTPKAQGAWNLHCSSLHLHLDFFVVYSSVTTLFGNPGQANYVAANTYLESLIGYRRSIGLPGLYIAWGPIADVGYLARNEKLKHVLASRMGSQIFTSQQALQMLEKIIPSTSTGLTVANLNISKMMNNLPVFTAPKFCKLVAQEQHYNELTSDQSDDIRMLIADKSTAEALGIISQILTGEIAKILRMPAEKIDKKESLLHIGMDSLVGAELANAIEQRFALQMPMLALSQGLSVQTLAERIFGQLNKEEASTSQEPDLSAILREASLHGETLTTEDALELVRESQASMVE